MIVYGSSLSPFVRKVLVICAEKGIQVENVLAGPGVPPPEGFAEISPFGRIPVLRDGDYTLADSSAIAHYLEAKHPEPPLIPQDPEARGRVVWFDETADTELFRTIVKIFFNRIVAPLTARPYDLAAADRAQAEELPAQLDYMERVTPERGWLVGDAFTLADISVGAAFVNWMLTGARIDEAAHPRLGAYLRRVHERPSFQPIVAANHALVERVRDRVHLTA